MSDTKLKVLLLAEQCNPEWPSLPIVGYKACKAIADFADVTVITQIRNKENIDKAGFGNAKVIYIDSEYIARPIHKFLSFLRGEEGAWTTVQAFNYPSYLAFERACWKLLKNKELDGEFDIIHRVTPMSPTLPSPIAKWSKMPFIIGPLNGGLVWPEDFKEELAQEKEWLTHFRDFFKVLPYYKSTYRNAAVILSSFQHTVDNIPLDQRYKSIDFPEVGIDPELFSIDSFDRTNTNKQKTIIFAGRLVPYKMPEVVVRAFVNSEVLQKHKLIIAGDGPLRHHLESIVKEHRLENIVELTGWKTQKEIGELMQKADIFAFPSIRELGAGVVVEAMACGLASVVVNHGAPGNLIGPDCGISVELSTREKLFSDFTAGLEKLIQAENLDEIKLKAHKRALKLFSWENKALKTIKVYNNVLNNEFSEDLFWN